MDLSPFSPCECIPGDLKATAGIDDGQVSTSETVRPMPGPIDIFPVAEVVRLRTVVSQRPEFHKFHDHEGATGCASADTPCG